MQIFALVEFYFLGNKKQETSSKKKISDKEQQIIFGIFFFNIILGVFKPSPVFTPETLTVSLSKSHPTLSKSMELLSLYPPKPLGGI